MHGMVIPEHNIRSIIKDFLKPPLFLIKTRDDEESKSIRLNMFGFELYGLSSGERSFLSLFSRLHYYKDRIKPGRDILFLIDEGELGFHPQWQKQYFNVLVDFIEKFFPKNTVQLIITSHSPFLASDLPTENILFLKKGESNRTGFHEEFSDKQTFASNIHALYSDAFFIQGATIGDFSKKILNEIIDYLNSGKYSPESNNRYRELIQKIGEPVIKNKLTELWIEKLGKEEEINALQERINFLRSQP
jgi:predicted ATP-binding protein involved in virulence